MWMQIITFQLEGISPLEYASLCEQQFSPAFPQMDGLISKVWLSNPETNTYGGIYAWRDRAALDAYKSSEIYRSIFSLPFLKDAMAKEYGVLEMPTRLTRGWAAPQALSK
jgi:hypothetical protein